MPGTEVENVFSISTSLDSSLLKIQTWQSYSCVTKLRETVSMLMKSEMKIVFWFSYLRKTKIANLPKISVTGREGKTGSGANQSKTALVWGPCGFRPFDFYSKLKIKNQKFTIMIFNVWYLKNWKSQIYNLSCQFLFLRNIKLQNDFQCFENQKLKMVSWWFLFLVFKEKEN